MSRLASMPITIEHVLLGLLRQRPRYGYEINRQLARGSGLGLIWQVKPSQLYALLAKLEKEGYVAWTLKAQTVRPARKVFHLTPYGQEAILAWISSPVQHMREMRQEFLAKLYFAQCEGAEVALRLLQQQRQVCRGWLERQESWAQRAGQAGSFDWTVCGFRTSQTRAMLEWLDACEQQVADTSRHVVSPDRQEA